MSNKKDRDDELQEELEEKIQKSKKKKPAKKKSKSTTAEIEIEILDDNLTLEDIASEVMDIDKSSFNQIMPCKTCCTCN